MKQKQTWRRCGRRSQRLGRQIRARRQIVQPLIHVDIGRRRIGVDALTAAKAETDRSREAGVGLGLVW